MEKNVLKTWPIEVLRFNSLVKSGLAAVLWAQALQELRAPRVPWAPPESNDEELSRCLDQQISTACMAYR